VIKEVHSFDVFDTCLLRRTSTPSDIFYNVSQKVFEKIGLTESSGLVEEFVAARISAEHEARRNMDSEETTLENIWIHLCFKMGWDFDSALLDCELEAEKESLFPNMQVLEQVRLSRDQGIRVIFVSDMYLPKNFIWSILLEHKFALEGDGFYLSSEIKKTKSTGNLFKHILTLENVNASHILHTGDSQHSDYHVPQKLGIRANHFTAEQMSGAEMMLLQKSRHFACAAKLAGAMRAFRLRYQGENHEIDHLVSQFIGPFVMCFATWVLEQARKNGIKRLYFLSRDCQTTCTAASHLSKMFGGIDCRYLFVSRQALYLPASTDISESGMPWMSRDGEDPVLKNLLAKIDLPFEEARTVMDDWVGKKGENYRLKSGEDWKRFWWSLNQTPLKQRIRELINARKNAAQSYFADQGLIDDEPWAIVDLGWYLTGQKSLQSILKGLGWSKPIHGFYLALKQGRVGYAEAGLSQAMFYQPPHDFTESRYETNIYYSQTLLEHVIGIADHPSVHHYEILNGIARPVFQSANTNSDSQMPILIQKSLIKFVTENQTLAKDFQDEAFCRDAISSLTESFYLNPEPICTVPLLKVSFSGDQNGLNPIPIVKKAGLSYILEKNMPHWVPFFRNKKSDILIWPNASLAIAPKSLKVFAKIICLPFIIMENFLKVYNSITEWVALRTRIKRLFVN